MRPLWLSAVLALALSTPSVHAQELVAASSHMPRYPSVQAMTIMDRLVAERTGGRVRVKVLPKTGATTLFTLHEVRSGTVAMATFSVALLNDSVPETIALSLPFLFESKAHARTTFDGPVGQQVLAALERDGLVGLCFYDVGDRSIFTVRRPIRSAVDMMGLRVRSLQSEMWRAAIEAMGARPVLLPYEQISAELTSGLIDAADDNWAAYISSHEHKAAKIYSLTRHTRAPEVLVVSKRIWQRLSPPDQNIVRAAAKETAAWVRQQVDALDASAARSATAAGVEIVGDVDRKSFADAMAPLYATYTADPAVKELVDRIRSHDPAAREISDGH